MCAAIVQYISAFAATYDDKTTLTDTLPEVEKQKKKKEKNRKTKKEMYKL